MRGYHATTLSEYKVDMGRVPSPVGVATLAVRSPLAMEVPSVEPVVAGVSLVGDPQAPAASATMNGLSLAVFPAAAVDVSATSSSPSGTARADVLLGWVADAAARGVSSTSVSFVPSPAARRGGEAVASI